MIDFDRSTLRIPATGWREGNLARLRRSLLTLRGHRSIKEVEEDFARLRKGYDAQWDRGICWSSPRRIRLARLAAPHPPFPHSPRPEAWHAHGDHPPARAPTAK